MGCAAKWRRFGAPVLALLALLQGCAATGPKGTELVATLNAIPAGFGRIVFFRSSSVVGAAVQPEIRIDARVVGQSRPGGFFYVDAAPGRYVASAATEATSTLEIQVGSGQTIYVRSAIGFGLMVGRVTLSVESPAAGRSELAGLSYTGSTVPRLGTAAAATEGAAPAATAAAADAVGSVSGSTVAGSAAGASRSFKRGDRVVYRLTDGYTGVTRDAVYRVDRVDGERIVFAGGRIEQTDGTVVQIGTPLAGDMDYCAPPAGWKPPADAQPGTRWNLRFYKSGTAPCSGEYELQAQLVADEVLTTPFGDVRAQRIDYSGHGSRPNVQIEVRAQAWYAPALGRVVRFESETTSRIGRGTAPPNREKVELIEALRD